MFVVELPVDSIGTIEHRVADLTHVLDISAHLAGGTPKVLCDLANGVTGIVINPRGHGENARHLQLGFFRHDSPLCGEKPFRGGIEDP